MGNLEIIGQSWKELLVNETLKLCEVLKSCCNVMLDKNILALRCIIKLNNAVIIVQFS